MNFLTIEKFSSRPKRNTFKKVVLGLIMLVVPTMFVAAWVFYNFNNLELVQKTQVVTKPWESVELTLLSNNK